MTAEVEWALMKAKVVQLEEELAELREETIVSLQIKTDKLCKDFSTVKNIAIMQIIISKYNLTFFILFLIFLMV